jgi:hypothetical protein
MTENTWQDDKPQDKPVRSKKVATADIKDDEPQFFRVRQTHPAHNKRVVFRSVSESRAKAFVENRFPRGSEVYLESPNGDFSHYEAERAGDKGQDIENWQSFDPASWVAPEEAVAPGQDSWADKEG